MWKHPQWNQCFWKRLPQDSKVVLCFPPSTWPCQSPLFHCRSKWAFNHLGTVLWPQRQWDNSRGFEVRWTWVLTWVLVFIGCNAWEIASPLSLSFLACKMKTHSSKLYQLFLFLSFLWSLHSFIPLNNALTSRPLTSFLNNNHLQRQMIS